MNDFTRMNVGYTIPGNDSSISLDDECLDVNTDKQFHFHFECHVIDLVDLLYIV